MTSKMTSRERQLATIRHELSDRISVDAIAVENQTEIAQLLGIDPSAVLAELGLDGRVVSAGYLGELPPPLDGEAINEWGTHGAADYGLSHRYPLVNVKSVAEVDRHRWPDPGRYDYARAGDAARELAERYAIRGPYWQPLFCRVCALLGIEEALVMMAAEPRLFEAVLEQVSARTIEFCERLLQQCGDAMPILCLGDDFATQRGMMMSPALWRKFLKPRYARVFEVGKRAGKHIWVHSCGDITAVLPDLIDIGMDVWETVQLHTLPVSPQELKREYGGHVTFFGGVNTQRLPFMSREEVRGEVRKCIDVLGRNGGYICGPDHHVKPDVSAENTVALFATAREFRRDGYTIS